VSILERTSRQARPCPNERLNAGDLKHDHQPLVLRREWAYLFPQHREKESLNVIPGV
jgi:hypothetical protein